MALATALEGGFAITGTDEDAPGSVNWTYSVMDVDLDFLAEGETITFTYTVTITDDEGATDTDTVTVTITGTNDQPEITVDTGDSAMEEITETDSPNLMTSGTLSVEDLDITDTVSVSVISVSAVGPTLGEPDNATLLDMLTVDMGDIIDGTMTTGTINWEFDSGSETFDYLADGESLVLTYTVQTLDDSGVGAGAGADADSDTQTVTITINGTNDQPEITVDTGDSAMEEITETDSPNLMTSGTLSVEDLDITDTVSVSVISVSAVGPTLGEPDNATLLDMLTVDMGDIIDGTMTTGTINWEFDSGSETFDYLADGESLVLTYTVQTLDDSGVGAGAGADADSDTQTVTITINGTNDEPVITDGPDIVELDETNAGLTTSGTLTITDLDFTDTVTAIRTLVVSGTSDRSYAVAPSDGDLLAMLTIFPMDILDGTEQTDTLNWEFDSGGETFNYLVEGQTLILTYTVEVEDIHGATDTEIIKITIIGTNDVPILSQDELIVIREALRRSIHNALLPAGQVAVPEVNLADLVNSGIVEDERITLDYMFFDPDQGDLVDAELFLVTADVWNSLAPGERIDSSTPGVTSLGFTSDIDPDVDGFASGSFASKIKDDFPVGTPFDEMVFVVRLTDSLDAVLLQSVTEDSGPATYTVFNTTPILFTENEPISSYSPEVQAVLAEIQSQISSSSVSTRIEFNVSGSNYIGTFLGFAFESTSPNVESIEASLIDNISGNNIGGPLSVQTSELVTITTKTVDTYGNEQLETLNLGRFFEVTFITPVTNPAINFGGSELDATLLIEDNDLGQSTLSGLSARFPAVSLPPLPPPEVESVLEEVEAEPIINIPRVLSQIRQVVISQSSQSRESETDAFEVLIRIVVDDGDPLQNQEPLYQYFDYFEEEEEEDRNAGILEKTLDQAGRRLEQFLDKVSGLPDNRYQIILRQTRGGVIISDTIILDVTLKDGEIIEKSIDSSEEESNEQSSIEAPPNPNELESTQATQIETPQRKQSFSFGAAALPIWALAEFRQRKRRLIDTQREPASDPSTHN